VTSTRAHGPVGELGVRRPFGVWLLVGLVVVLSVSAIGGGIALLLDTSGRAAGLTPGLLATAPVSTYLLPGLFLLLVFGVGGACVAWGIAHQADDERTRERRHWSWHGSIVLGVTLMGWIAIQVVLIEHIWLQPVMFGMGLALAGVPLLPSVRRDLRR
jgi:hypothetical protein